MSNVTSNQVAKLAGVSRTTVSFVLNDVPGMGISQETRERVLTAAKQLGYVANAIARSLASGATRTVALVMPHRDHINIDIDAYLPRFLAGINLTCHASGYKLLFEPVEESSRPGVFADLVDSRRVDGLIVLNPRGIDDAYLCQLAGNGFPLVVFGSNLSEHKGICSIDADNRDAARRATSHLLALGHRQIAHLGYASDENQIPRERLRGFHDAMQAHGADINPAWIAYGNYSAQSGYDAMRSMLQRAPGMTALFAGNDTIAFGAMAALRDAGLRTPEDVAIVGYDDIPLAAFAAPPLTTMRTEPYKDGSDAASILLQAIAGEALDKVYVRDAAPLIVRRSCGSGKD